MSSALVSFEVIGRAGSAGTEFLSCIAGSRRPGRPWPVSGRPQLAMASVPEIPVKRWLVERKIET